MFWGKILITNESKSDIKCLIKTATPPSTHQVKQQLLHTLGMFINDSSEEGESVVMAFTLYRFTM